MANGPTSAVLAGASKDSDHSSRQRATCRSKEAGVRPFMDRSGCGGPRLTCTSSSIVTRRTAEFLVGEIIHDGGDVAFADTGVVDEEVDHAHPEIIAVEIPAEPGACQGVGQPSVPPRPSTCGPSQGVIDPESRGGPEELVGHPPREPDGEPGGAQAAPVPQVLEPILLLPGLGGLGQEPGREHHRGDGVVGQQVVGQRREEGDRVASGGRQSSGARRQSLQWSQVVQPADDPGQIRQVDPAAAAMGTRPERADRDRTARTSRRNILLGPSRLLQAVADGPIEGRLDKISRAWNSVNMSLPDRETACPGPG